ncbi:LytTR family DNA-binding domain-containing protein [Neolewinella lacunae]|uniref:Response regulator transcription factor n=1 Tax=Neolewinella lacunae TaxID=1517758 RepID=A0A923PQJ6_9BACT|nr:LytTR family DNA-binding domain-containing protein [Neolewinella lacunae]MBC6995644.1 response regulator transcription factor [Neolewinella lacunae]MDN3634289.1 LytTR family DNA-binding domain-containing protein [Neolewinella lacunae]
MTPKFNAIVIEDEKSEQDILITLLQKHCPEIKLLGVGSSVGEADELIRNLQPQLVFLDIQLGDETAFTLLSQLEAISFEIIFVTAHDQYALQAFEYMAVDYLLKPIDVNKFIRAVNSAKVKIEGKFIHASMGEMLSHVRTFNRNQHKIALSTSSGYELVPVKDIMYCLADGSYTHFFCVGREPIMVSKNLKHYETLLADYAFSRIHPTALVNLFYVKKIDRSEGGSLVMEDERTLPISKAKRQELEASIKENHRLV